MEAIETRQSLNVALTFDDGYLEHANIARLLYSLHVRATFFIITGLSKWNGRPLLTLRPDLLHQMRAMKHEIGSHTHTHPNLLSLTDGEINQELSKSKNYLEYILGDKVEGFSYPYGKYDDRIIRLVREHYSYARAAHQIEHYKENMYEVPIRSPGRNLAHASLLMSKEILRGGISAAILLHSVPQRSVKLWITYLKSAGVNFLTLGNLVKAKYHLGY